MIEGFLGLMGMGKTMLGVDHSVRLAARRGSWLVSNILITPLVPLVKYVQLGTGDDGLDVVELERLLTEAKAAKCGVVLYLDEIGILMPARFWATFPVSLMWMLSQSRKLKIDLVFSAQDIEQVDSFLRRLTQWVYRVKAFPTPTLERREAGRRPWFFVVSKWRPTKVDKRGEREGLRRIRYRREWEGQYDTDEIVRPPARLTRPKTTRGRE